MQYSDRGRLLPVGSFGCPPDPKSAAMSQLSFDHLLNLSLAFHTRRKTGEVLRVLDRGASINHVFEVRFQEGRGEAILRHGPGPVVQHCPNASGHCDCHRCLFLLLWLDALRRNWRCHDILQ